MPFSISSLIFEKVGSAKSSGKMAIVLVTITYCRWKPQGVSYRLLFWNTEQESFTYIGYHERAAVPNS